MFQSCICVSHVFGQRRWRNRRSQRFVCEQIIVFINFCIHLNTFSQHIAPGVPRIVWWHVVRKSSSDGEPFTTTQLMCTEFARQWAWAQVWPHCLFTINMATHLQRRFDSLQSWNKFPMFDNKVHACLSKMLRFSKVFTIRVYTSKRYQQGGATPKATTIATPTPTCKANISRGVFCIQIIGEDSEIRWWDWWLNCCRQAGRIQTNGFPCLMTMRCVMFFFAYSVMSPFCSIETRFVSD